MENKIVQPTAADYRTFIDHIYENLRAFANHEIDDKAFRRRLNELEAESRSLNLIAKLHRLAEQLNAGPKKSRKAPVNS